MAFDSTAKEKAILAHVEAETPQAPISKSTVHKQCNISQRCQHLYYHQLFAASKLFKSSFSIDASLVIFSCIGIDFGGSPGTCPIIEKHI